MILHIGTASYASFSIYKECSRAAEFLKPERPLKLFQSVPVQCQEKILIQSANFWRIWPEYWPSLLQKRGDQDTVNTAKYSTLSKSLRTPCGYLWITKYHFILNAESYGLFTTQKDQQFVLKVFDMIPGLEIYLCMFLESSTYKAPFTTSSWEISFLPSDNGSLCQMEMNITFLHRMRSPSFILKNGSLLFRENKVIIFKDFDARSTNFIHSLPDVIDTFLSTGCLTVVCPGPQKLRWWTSFKFCGYNSPMLVNKLLKRTSCIFVYLSHVQFNLFKVTMTALCMTSTHFLLDPALLDVMEKYKEFYSVFEPVRQLQACTQGTRERTKKFTEL